jgi:hypothetical protein
MIVVLLQKWTIGSFDLTNHHSLRPFIRLWKGLFDNGEQFPNFQFTQLDVPSISVISI